ncbi:MAG TPA: acyl-CoA carboxylase subunit epsilon [Actinocrinis sp.]|nr:acyl-CoA carboxylase subunit epsilon [Actinocrinis sp.]
MSNAETAIDGAPESAEAQILRVLRGNPNPAEVAALIVALAHVRARNAAEADRDAGDAHLPPSASWDRPQPVSYRSPASWMRAA